MILRINKRMILKFANSFFAAKAQQNITENIFEYFQKWMVLDSDDIQDKVSYILGMNKQWGGTPSDNDYVKNLITEMSSLFP